jgi:PAS domain S-box-containing protein
MAKEGVDSALLRLVAIVESADAAIYSADLTGTITSWNRAAVLIFGYPAAEAIGQPLRIIIPPDRLDEEAALVERIRAGQSVNHYETVRRRRDGSLIDVAMTVSPIRGPAGEVIGISKIARDITEQRVLEHQSRHLVAIVQSSDDAIVSKDLNGTIKSWNRAAERMFGYAADEVIGQSIRIIVPADRQSEEDDVLRRIQRGEAIDHFETVRQRRDGRSIPISLTVSPIRDRDGRIIGASKIARDISTEKRHEGQLRLQSRLLDLSDEAIFAWELDGGIVIWNNGSERLYGYTREDAVGRASHELLQTVYPGPRSEVLAALQAGRQWDGEVHHRTRNGREIVVESRQQPLEVGGRQLVLETNRDVTEQRRADKRATFLVETGKVLAGSLDYEATLTAIATLAVPAIADWCAVDIVTTSGKIERLAVAHRDPAKVELVRIIGERYREHYEDPKVPYSPAHVIRTGESVVVPLISDGMIVTVARGDEERIRFIRSLGLVSYICVPLVARGSTLGALTFATAESQRQYSRDDLQFAQEVAYRATLAVDNARAYKEARLASQLKDEFLATVSHELRTPLNAILGYARLLKSGMMTEEKQTRALTTVERNATALAQIVEDILDVSRIISGKVRLNIQPVDLPSVVQHAIETIMPAADAKQIRVQTTLDPRAAPISGDPDRLQQIVFNLVSNAVKFTPKGGLVQVRLGRIDSSVEIVVSDTGIGIKPEFLPHLFERFRQGDGGLGRENSGLGLGLAIVRHLVELHGGTVRAASAGPGKGATLRVRLPIMIVHPEVVAGPHQHPARHTGGRFAATLEGIHVLAVDDDTDALTLVREIVEAAGARVSTVDSAAKALDQLEAAAPDVIVADIGLPLMDGFEFIGRVRQLADSTLRRTPAAALTAYARSEDRVRALQSGFQMHLAKPVDPAELVAAVAALAQCGRAY